MDQDPVSLYINENPSFKGIVELPRKNTTVKPVNLPNFPVNKKVYNLSEEYNFIDIDKLLEKKDKKYKIVELRDIAKKLDISLKNNKKDLVRLIKLKIGIED